MASKGSQAVAANSEAPTPLAAESIDASVSAPVPSESEPDYSEREECRDPCRRLVDEPFEALADQVSKDCAIDWREHVDSLCHQWDGLQECLYAAAGNPFKEASVRESYEDADWYRPNPKFKESQLSSVARANLELLKERRFSCEEKQVNKPGEEVEKIEVDLDGDGTAEVIRLTTSRVFVDGQEFVHRLKPYDAQSMKLSVVDLDTRDPYKELMIANYHYEQNAFRRILWKRKDTAQMSEVYNWHDITLSFEGKGEIRLQSGECGQDRLEIYGFKKGVFQLKRKKVKGKYREEYCSACPYVFVRDNGHWEFQGEILRNLRAASLEDTHHLRLGRRQGTVRIRLAERKQEVTFLDSLEVLARYRDGSEEVMPLRECLDSSPPWCQLDQVHGRLEPGDDVDFSVVLDKPAELVLRARGYYLPL